MRTSRLPLTFAAILSACGTVHAAPPPPSFPGAPAMPPVVVPSIDQGNEVEVAEARPSPLSEAFAIRSAREGGLLGDASVWNKRASRMLAQVSGSSVAAGASTSVPSSPHKMREMIDVEATLNIVVENVVPAAASVRALARAAGAMITEDAVEEAGVATARFTIRVDAGRTEELLVACERLGQVRSRLINARDIGKEFHDTQLLLDNLEAAMMRYEEILAGATQVSDVLAIEKELGRLRAQIDKVKGTLLWMQDRVARSTLHVYLAAPRADEPDAVVIGHAKIYPGVRAAYLEDFRSGSNHGYWGGGLSLRFSREFGLDLDGLRRQGSASSSHGLDVFIATLGGEVFSEFLGNGRRRFLNPYLGWRLGYDRFEGHNEFAFAGSAGVEILKTRPLSIDLAARLFGFLGRNAHAAAEPALSVNVAF